jgi:hypothetical protein
MICEKNRNCGQNEILKRVRARRSRAAFGSAADDDILRRFRIALNDGDRIERVVLFGRLR